MYDMKDIPVDIHSLKKWRRKLSFHQVNSAFNYTVNIHWLNSVLEGNPGTDPQQQVFKQGLGEPEVAAAVIQV